MLLTISAGAIMLGITPLSYEAVRNVGAVDGMNVTVDSPPEGFDPFDGSSACIDEREISVSADAAFLCTAGGQVLYAKQQDIRLPMASITKIMTALVVIENALELKKTVKVSPNAVGIEGSSIYLCANDIATVSDLLYALLLASANDAAVALAIDTAGSVDGFVSMMNSKAQSLGMYDTAFTNPHGLFDKAHYTTARDYAVLMSHAMTVPAFKEISGTVSKIISINGVPRSIHNHNRLLSSCEGVISGKTGYTIASGRTLVTAATRNGVTLICVTLNAPDDWNDHKKMYAEGFARTRVTVFKAEDHSFELPVVGAEASGGTVSVVPESDVRIVTLREYGYRLRYSYPIFVYAPVLSGERVGFLYISGEDGFNHSVALVTKNEVRAFNTQNGVLWRLNAMWRALINKEKE